MFHPYRYLYKYKDIFVFNTNEKRNSLPSQKVLHGNSDAPAE